MIRRSPPPPSPATNNNKNVVLLVLSSIIMLGLYYLIAMPASVRHHLKTIMMIGNDTTDDVGFEKLYQLMFTLAYLPGIVLPFFAGNIVDRIGARFCLLVLSTNCCIGQVIAAAGVMLENWAAILLGRLLFGIGFESLFVANEAFLASIYCDQNLGMALGVSSAASYIGYLLSPILSPIAANAVSVAFAFWLGAIFIGASVLASLAIFVIAPKNTVISCVDDSVENTDADGCESGRSKNDNMESRRFGAGEPETTDQTSQRSRRQSSSFVDLSHIRHLGISFWLLCISCAIVYGVVTSFTGVASGLLLERYLFLDPPSDCVIKNPDQCPSGYLAPGYYNNISVDQNANICPKSDTVSPVLPLSINVTMVGNDGPSSWDNSRYAFDPLSSADIDCTDDFWSQACTQEYCSMQESATKQAGILMATPFIVTVLTTSLFGRFGVDWAGLHFPMVAFAPALLVVAHTLFPFGKISAIVPLIMMGFGFSMYVSALWPSVAILASEDTTGTAFGIITCIQAVGNAILPLLVAAIYNNTGQSYVPNVELLFLVCSTIVVGIGVALYRIESRQNQSSRFEEP